MDVMRDLSGHFRRYRLTRYALPDEPWRRVLRLVLLGAAAWLVWASLLSGHGFFKLWRLDRENARTERELTQTRAELDRLDAQLSSPRALKGLAERALREQSGMAKPGEIVYRIRSASDSALAR